MKKTKTIFGFNSQTMSANHFIIHVESTKRSVQNVSGHLVLLFYSLKIIFLRMESMCNATNTDNNV